MEYLKGEVWTNSENGENLMFTSDDGKHEGKVFGCPEGIAYLGMVANDVVVTKHGKQFHYYSEG